jgi:ribose 5-phosphate isomerase B
MHKDANHCRSVDYPDYARKIADVFHPRVPISLQFADFGVLICGTGIGMSIAANRHSHIRAALCHDVTTAKLARQHNDANVLVLGARLIAFPLAIEIFETFASTDFEGGRHSARILKLNVED